LVREKLGDFHSLQHFLVLDFAIELSGSIEEVYELVLEGAAVDALDELVLTGFGDVGTDLGDMEEPPMKRA
jgi:hypothetical protein